MLPPTTPQPDRTFRRSSDARLLGRIGGLTTHATHDSHALAQRARDGFLARFALEVDPRCELPEAERTRRADLAKRAYMTALALRSAQARRRKRAAVAPASEENCAAEGLP